MASDELKNEIKALIIEAIQIEDVTPEEIDSSASLFESDLLGLNSIDGLELVAALQRDYGARIDDQNLARNVLQSVDTMAEFVEKCRQDMT